jgi:hypothetical protein
MICIVSKTNGKDGTGLQLIIAYCGNRYLGCSCRLPLWKQEKKNEHFTCILFTFLKTYEEKFPKTAKVTKMPLEVQNLSKNYPKTEKITYKIYISVASSSSPGFIYLRKSHKIQEKKL